MSLRQKKKFFSKFYDNNVEKIYRFVFLKVRSEEASKDLTSESFLRLWEQLKSPTEIENPRAYLYQIARNLVADHYRKKEKNKTTSLEFIQIIDERANSEEKTVLESDVSRIRIALSNLKEEHQDVLIWYYLDELSVPEIAKIENKSENAVRVNIHRALQALKKELSTAE